MKSTLDLTQNIINRKLIQSPENVFYGGPEVTSAIFWATVKFKQYNNIIHAGYAGRLE